MSEKIYVYCKKCGKREELYAIGASGWPCVCGQYNTIEPKVPTPEEGEHSGGSVDYYKVWIANPTTPGVAPYMAECNDIIEALNMNYAQANVFKAQWRIAAAKLGKKKKGNNKVYDAEKSVFFSNRVLVQEKQNHGND